MAAASIDPQLVRQAMGEPRGGDQAVDRAAQTYRDMLGFLPPRVQARLHVTGALDPTLLDLQEKIRTHALNPACFDDKTVQLMVFGMLMANLSDAATIHGIAARRAGASWEEMQAVVSLAYLFRGVSAANRGADVLAEIARREAAAPAQA
jgi:alkylhydroperoxidase/carboxymuconolactone decarboxylase family protein YurZ